MKAICTAMVMGLLLSLLSTAAQARIGDTPEKLASRFGDPVRTGTDFYRYIWDQYEIFVMIEAGKSVTEIYSRRDGRAFTHDDFFELLARVTGVECKGWSVFKKDLANQRIVWVSLDKKLFCFDNVVKRSITIAIYK